MFYYSVNINLFSGVYAIAHLKNGGGAVPSIDVTCPDNAFSIQTNTLYLKKTINKQNTSLERR